MSRRTFVHAQEFPNITPVEQAKRSALDLARAELDSSTAPGYIVVTITQEALSVLVPAGAVEWDYPVITKITIEETA